MVGEGEGDGVGAAEWGFGVRRVRERGGGNFGLEGWWRVGRSERVVDVEGSRRERG